MNTKLANVLSSASALSVALLCASTFTVPVASAQNSSSGKPARVRTDLTGFELSPKAGKSANQVGGASRDLGSPRLFAPNLGKCFTTTPEFHWAPPAPGDKVTFRLYSADGQLLYELATTADRLKYPADAPALAAGSTYKWTVVPENDMLGGPPAPVSFMIVADPERGVIANEVKAAASPAAVAEVFVAHRLWYDAVQSYSDQLAQTPSDNTARTARADLYDQLPATKPLAVSDRAMLH